MIVVDASVIVELLLNTPDAPAVGDRLLAPGESWHAPHLLDVEVTQVLRRYSARGELPAEQAGALLDLLREMPIARYPHAPLLDRMWRLRENLTAYDAAYVALAEGLDVPLVTRDARLAAAPGLAARVEVV